MNGTLLILVWPCQRLVATEETVRNVGRNYNTIIFCRVKRLSLKNRLFRCKRKTVTTVSGVILHLDYAKKIQRLNFICDFGNDRPEECNFE
jgi:hypothetical protein